MASPPASPVSEDGEPTPWANQADIWDDMQQLEAFVGYNEWARTYLGVHTCTDFVYEYESDDEDDDDAEGAEADADAASAVETAEEMLAKPLVHVANSEPPPAINPAAACKHQQRQKTEDRERGVFVAEDIAPQSVVLSIPFESLLTVDWVRRKHRVLRQIKFFQHLDAETEDDQLAIALLYEKFVAREQSKWFPHITVLPRTYHNIMYFTKQQVDMLQGSNLFFIAEQIHDKVKSDYLALRQKVLRDVATMAVQHGETPEAVEHYFSFENYVWALSTVWSRFVSLNILGEDDELENDAAEPIAVDATGKKKKKKKKSRSKRHVSPEERAMTSLKAMVPVFDMLNHDPAAQMQHYYDIEANAFVLVSNQHWQAGAQLFVNYGPLSNHKLLALYGFVLPNNPFDAIDVWVPMDEATTKLYDLKAHVLEINGIDHLTTPFELTIDHVNELLLIIVRLQEISTTSKTEFEEAAARALDGEIVHGTNENFTLLRLIYTFEQLLAHFPTTCEQDDEQLREHDNAVENGDTDKILSLHDRMAIVLRKSDKLILKENIKMLKWRLLKFLPEQPIGATDTAEC
ncbi:TPA: hypothetical protein N0F65_003527 [Lagenidium giganteum]|uniref:SET domain-containing protein n=1 Tax=Lagenidium giganteum TaxID=4803 RepID=A0AAV2YXM7_9STRA|nr:TPA: hypothetical protein N0F65_003527 [Lagenidium giganteum]